MPQSDVSEEQKKEESKRSRLLEIQKEAAKYYMFNLRFTQGILAMQYLKTGSFRMKLSKALL